MRVFNLPFLSYADQLAYLHLVYQAMRIYNLRDVRFSSQIRARQVSQAYRRFVKLIERRGEVFHEWETILS